MTWDETRRRQAVLREVERVADADPTGRLPWDSETAETYGEPARLLLALRHRWDVMVQCQLDPELGADVVARNGDRLRTDHPGLVRILRRYPSDRSGTENPLSLESIPEVHLVGTR